MIIGAVTLVIGYLVGIGRVMNLYIKAQKYAEHGDKVLVQIKKELKRITDEQQE